MHIILKPQNERDAILAAARAALQQQQELALAAGGARLWSTLLNLSQPIFQGRSLLHNKRAAEAAYRQVLANHKAVTLQAFADVADALWALEQDTQTYDAFVEAERISQQSLDLAQLQYKVGTGDYTDVLTAQQTYQQARISRATAEADRYLDAVLLFQALGGGWWNRPETLAGQVQLLAASTAGNTP
jgi:outer membrane protein TolC